MNEVWSPWRSSCHGGNPGGHICHVTIEGCLESSVPPERSMAPVGGSARLHGANVGCHAGLRS